MSNDITNQSKLRDDLLLWAYAYEVEGVSLVSDEKFDAACKNIDSAILTGAYDDFWNTEFNPYTGMWIHKYPDIASVKVRFAKIEKKKATPNLYKIIPTLYIIV